MRPPTYDYHVSHKLCAIPNCIVEVNYNFNAGPLFNTIWVVRGWLHLGPVAPPGLEPALIYAAGRRAKPIPITYQKRRLINTTTALAGVWPGPGREFGFRVGRPLRPPCRGTAAGGAVTLE